MKTLFFFGLLFFVVSLKAQIVLDNSQTIQQLIENVLVSDGVTISNVTFQGNQNLQVASFTDPNANFGFESGLYMTTGRTNQLNFSSIFNSEEGIDYNSTDQDIARLTSGSLSDVHDAVVIQFDFVPTGDSVSFKYVFASEEYPEYSCSDFNDAFGFFLRGPGINGSFSNNAKNIALVPNTFLAVAINTINNGQIGALAIPPDPQCVRSNSQYYINNTVGSTPTINQSLPIIYDAFTTVLEAKSAVQCGQTYHIKLVIADIFDNIFDSGVFLEANSFNSTNINLGYTGVAFNNGTNEAYEGCPLNLTFSRPPNVTTDTIRIQLDWSGTATEFIDYNGTIDEVVFPPGIDTIQFPIFILLDNLVEGVEIIEVNILSTSCAGAGFTFEIKLNDPPPIVIGIADTIDVPCTDSLQINPIVSGGTGNFTYNWMNNVGTTISTTDLSSWLDASDEGEYTLVVIDSCSRDTAQKTFYLQQERINATAGFSVDNAINCLGDLILLTNTSPNGNEFEWSINGVMVSQEFEPIINFTTLNNSIIQLLVSDSTGCLFPDSMIRTVMVNDSAYANFTTQIVCPNHDFSLTSIDLSSGNNYLWTTSIGTNGTQSSITLNFPLTDIYPVSLMVTNTAGCTDNITKNIFTGNTIVVKADFTLPANRFCLGDAIRPINNSTNATDYLWNSGAGETSTDIQPVFTYSDTGYYTISLIASSTEDCTNIDTLFTTIHFEKVVADFIVDTLCQYIPFSFTSLNNPIVASYSWAIDGTVSGSTNPYIFSSNNVPGDFEMTLNISSDIGCSASLSRPFRVDEKPIAQFDNTNICVGSFTSFENTSVGDITDFLWDFGDGNTSMFDSPDIIYWNEGLYTVQLIAFADNCPSDTFSKQLQAFFVPEINIGDDLELCNGETVRIGIPDSVFNQLDYVLWSDSSTGDSINVSTLYSSVSVIGGVSTCTKTDEVLISEKCEVYAPTAFSPNGDGINDFFNALPENIVSYTMNIYNRWGELLFTTSDFDKGWDGTQNGQKAPIDVYSYILNGSKLDASNFTASGTFTIVR